MDKQSHIKIERHYFKDCTIGRLWCGEFQCFTLELPMLDNKTNVSCILPASGYRAFKRNSPKNGNVLEFKNVPERTHVQVHAGNYISQIQGCILVGDSIKFLNDDKIPDVTNSKNTLNKLLSLVEDEVTIEIV